MAQPKVHAGRSARHGVLAASLLIVRYWERPSRARLLVAGGAAAAASAVKPGVGLFFVVALYLALAVANHRARHELLSGRFVLFTALAMSLVVMYITLGRYVTDFIDSNATTGRVTPDLVFTSGFWSGWWEMLSFYLRSPQTQEFLAIAALAVAALGLVLAPRGVPRAILVGLTTGYVVFALVYATYTATHPCYALPLIPILALAIGVVVGWTFDRLEAVPVARLVLLLIVAAIAAGASQKGHWLLATEPPREAIADYRRIGELTGHTTKAILVNPSLGHPVMYWGWISGEDWDLGYETLPPWIQRDKDYLVVAGNHQLSHEGLRAFSSRLPVVARTDRFTIFDVRGAMAGADE